jgi:hypothetical protein
MLDPRVCDRCWEKEMREVDHCPSSDRSSRKNWLCVLHVFDKLTKESEPPKGCLRLFEHAIYAGMTNAK